VIAALAKLAVSIITMQWINATVRNAAFAPAFLGSP
jgi:uncharacterized membrane protein